MATAAMSKLTRQDYQVEHPNDWCPGCGDFGILTAVQHALAGLQLTPHQVAIFGGIGCSGKAVYYLPTYGVHTLHGRVLPFATGAKLANPDLTVVAVGGDGDGQQAIQHPGLSYLDVLQPCPTYNDLYTKEWFAGKDVAGGQARLYDVAQGEYDPVIPAGASEELTSAKVTQFMAKAHEWGRRIPIGLLLENRTLSTFEQRLAARIPSYREAPPARRVIADANGHPTTDLQSIVAELAIT